MPIGAHIVHWFWGRLSCLEDGAGKASSGRPAQHALG